MPPLPPLPLMFSHHPSIRPNTLQWCPHSCLRGCGYQDTCQSLLPLTHTYKLKHRPINLKTFSILLPFDYFLTTKTQISNIPLSNASSWYQLRLSKENVNIRHTVCLLYTQVKKNACGHRNYGSCPSDANKDIMWCCNRARGRRSRWTGQQNISLWKRAFS